MVLELALCLKLTPEIVINKIIQILVSQSTPKSKALYAAKGQHLKHKQGYQNQTQGTDHVSIFNFLKRFGLYHITAP